MSEEQQFDTIRDTLLGTCIGATILDITATDTDEFLASDEPSKVYFHMSNGETIFVVLHPETLGLLGTEDED